MLTQPNTLDTVGLAKRIRLHALRMTSLGGTSHIGSVFSMADLLAVLYGRILRNRRREPSMAESGPLHPIEGARRSRRIRGFG